ncbi:MAG: VOC family protein [Myxococcaceae bacterium]
MHRSRLSTFVIDCKDGDIEQAATFWSAALGRSVKRESPEDPKYRTLEMQDDEVLVMVQKVDHESRIHLDIETDDIDAEVARLEALGAKRVEKIKTWWVMQAPTGQKFCVVRPQRQPLDQLPSANTWGK